MTAASLTKEEFDALQESMGRANRAANQRPSDDAVLATPVALICEERVTERARPAAFRVGTRWARLLRRSIPRLTGVNAEFEVAGADSPEVATLRDDLLASWTREIRVEGRPGRAVVAVSGPLIEALAIRVLGATIEAPREAAPSRAVLGVFARVGEAICGILGTAWQQEQGAAIQVSSRGLGADAIAAFAADAKSMIALRLTVGGETSGTIRLVAPAPTLVAPEVPERSYAVGGDMASKVLGQVPVEVRVELGRARLTAKQLASLEAGAVIELDCLVGDALLITIGGRPKAYGKPLISGEVIAVEVVSKTPR